jgi:hypothetical protein
LEWLDWGREERPLDAAGPSELHRARLALYGDRALAAERGPARRDARAPRRDLARLERPPDLGARPFADLAGRAIRGGAGEQREDRREESHLGPVTDPRRRGKRIDARRPTA